MSELVTFCTLRSGRIEARCGRHVVGVIAPWSPAMVGVRGNGCHYQIKITELQPAQEARSIAWARRQMLFAIADWFEGCGGGCFGVARAIREQAEREREAA